MASTEKRWLTAPNSRLSKSDLCTILRKEAAWETLPLETRQRIYALLPASSDNITTHDANLHPLKTTYKRFIEVALRKWQDDLVNGRQSRKWREEAMQASQDHADGKWNDLSSVQRQQYWADGSKVPSVIGVDNPAETPDDKNFRQQDTIMDDDHTAIEARE